jgi:four helix bundle protein
MKLEELQVYQLSMKLGEKVWNIVKDWSYFEKDTIGKQLVRAVDSIAANISEGFGRKDAKKFYYYSRGSLYETKTWLIKAKIRTLIKEEEFSVFEKDVNSL